MQTTAKNLSLSSYEKNMLVICSAQ